MKRLVFEDHPHQCRSFPISLVLDQVRSPRNVGMLFRLAEAMGVDHLYFCNDSIHPPNRKIRKAARSTIKRVDYTVERDLKSVLSGLQSEKRQLIGLELTDESVPLREYPFSSTKPMALIIGSEKYGLSDQVLQMLDAAVYIPLFGKNLSINVATATAIALYEITGKMGGA